MQQQSPLPPSPPIIIPRPLPRKVTVVRWTCSSNIQKADALAIHRVYPRSDVVERRVKRDAKARHLRWRRTLVIYGKVSSKPNDKKIA
jgi:hypothetical protein